jgi:hypothetical protein
MRDWACLLAIAILAGSGVVSAAAARETIMLRAGDAAGPNSVIAFDRDARPPKIIIRTDKAGVAGSRIAVRIDRADKPAFSHIFTTTECRFDDTGRKCDLTVPRSSPAFSAILTWFKRARQARITVEDAGVMRMDQTVSLIGFRARFRQ